MPRPAKAKPAMRPTGRSTCACTEWQIRSGEKNLPTKSRAFQTMSCPFLGRKKRAGLRRRGYLLGIVTDTMYPVEWKMRRLSKAGVAEFIDVVACSTVLGVHKPDPAMYLNALQQAQLTPGESAFVGHDATEITGARQAGIVTVAVNDEPGVHADHACHTMSELLDLPIFRGSDLSITKQRSLPPSKILMLNLR